jgi:alkanesulfonate monooxygenase SsuD/methylene tetrahydromethanopterin reductase-like flavin-dependent oxidoreductase (luciferase family)
MEHVPVSLVVNLPTPKETLEGIRRAEANGVPAVWSTIAGINPDPITVFGAAAAVTERIGMGTAIVPTYPRHPTSLVAQAIAMGGLAPGRFRLGVGPSHQFIIEAMYGIPFERPLEHTREYVTVLRALLWEGAVDFKGSFYRVKARLAGGQTPPRTPIPIAALRAPAFRRAGDIADGAISWLCPIPSLLETAPAALREGAAAAGRSTPPLIAHVPVVMSGDRAAIHAAVHKQIGPYARAPFYARMFGDSGFPVSADHQMSEALIDHLVVSGDAAAVAARLQEIRAGGVDEVMLTPIVIADAAAEETALAEAIRIVAA